MRSATLFLFAILSLFSLLVQAHPFIIVSTKITEIKVQRDAPSPTHVLQKRQGLLNDIASQVNSFFGADETTSSTRKTSTTKSVKTLPPPVTASASATSLDDADQEESSTTSTSSSSSSTISNTTSVTTSTSVTATPTATATAAQATSTSSVNSTSDGNGVSSGGIAIAVIMVLLVLIVTAWLIFKYHPKSQAWWAAREERKFHERSFRDAIDGKPIDANSGGQDDVRTRRQTMLKSFFAPSTAALGGGQEIRRKPVAWGTDSTGTSVASTPNLYDKDFGSSDTEKIVMTTDAAPMGYIERYSYVPHASPPSTSLRPPQTSDVVPEPLRRAIVSPISVMPKEDLDKLPPVSPISLRFGPTSRGTPGGRDLPPLPPVPPVSMNPGLIHAKRGSDGVFRLS